MFRKTLSRFLMLTFGFCVLGFAPVHAAGVSFLGGVSMTNTHTANLPTKDPIYRGTFGADLDFGMVPLLGLETGLYYQIRGFATPQAQLSVTVRSTYESAQYLTVPVLLRLTVVPGFLKVGLGPYFSYAMSDFLTSTTSSSGAQTKSDQTFSLANRNKFDFGALASVRGFMPVAPLVDVVADVRFQYSLFNLTTNPNLVQKYYDLSFMLGARIGF